MAVLKKRSLVMVLVLVVLTVFVFSGCGAAKSDVLRVGMEVGYPPMEMVDTDGKTVIGFDVDVAKEVAKRLGYKDIEIVQTAWDGIFAAVETDKFDVIISSVSIKPDRAEAHSLTKAYVANKQAIVTKKGDTSVKSLEDLVGKKVGLQSGTTSEDLLKEKIAGGAKIEYSPYQKVTQPFADLKIGRLDAVLVDIVVAGYYVVQDKETFDIAWESSEGEPYCLCFPKKDSELRDKANKVLDDMQADGTMATISTKWFSKDITKNLE